ncbi:MAG TPA: FAD binding domain-containing protein [Thermoleophilaceae bacterium]
MSASPPTIEGALAATGEYRAGGTDLQQRLRSGVSHGPVIDLAGLPGLDAIEWDEQGRATIGALAPIAALATDPRVLASYPGLALSAGALATPQIRAAGTLGGNLLQRNRCWYFQNPGVNCLKKGGDDCPARSGNHLYGVCFDLGPCVAPHPSTLGMALLAYGAEVDVAGGGTRSVAALYGDGSDGRHDHQLREHELLTAVLMPEPLEGERAAYFRAISRALAEWPLVEAVVRLVVADGTVRFARVAVGGVAPVPLRLESVEEALLNRPASPETFEEAVSSATQGARPLPMTRYKLELLPGTVRETLERAVAAGP